MSVAIRIDHEPERPLRSFACPDCRTWVTTREPAQKVCRDCAARRETRRLAARGLEAPLLRVATVDTSPTVAGAYEGWRQHHATCHICGRYDWFDPGAPRLCASDDVVRARTITRADGQVVGIVDAPDVAVLCPAGRARFQEWVRAALMGIRMGDL